MKKNNYKLNKKDFEIIDDVLSGNLNKSKELTPLEALKDLINFIGNGEIADTAELCEYVAKRKDIIETALKRYTTIEQFLTKRGFDNLEDFLKQLSEYVEISEKEHERLMMLESPSYQTLKREYDFGVEHYNELLNQYNKEHKALEIIKEKGNFISIEYDDYDDKYYIYDNEFYMHNEITKEEYELLEEVLL